MHGETTDGIYARAGLGEPGVRGTRPAVLVIDLSRGFTEAHWPTGADLTEVVSATNALLGVAHEADLPVLFTTIAYTASDVEGGCAWLRKVPGLGILREGSMLAELDPRLRVRARDQVIVKRNASAFFGTGLAATLTALRVDSVVVCGATTSGCVRASCVDAVSSGFSVLVPRECVGDRAAGPHEANLFDIDAKYGDVISLREAIDHLRGVIADGVSP